MLHNLHRPRCKVLPTWQGRSARSTSIYVPPICAGWWNIFWQSPQTLRWAGFKERVGELHLPMYLMDLDGIASTIVPLRSSTSPGSNGLSWAVLQFGNMNFKRLKRHEDSLKNKGMSGYHMSTFSPKSKIVKPSVPRACPSSCCLEHPTSPAAMAKLAGFPPSP